MEKSAQSYSSPSLPVPLPFQKVTQIKQLPLCSPNLEHNPHFYVKVHRSQAFSLTFWNLLCQLWSSRVPVTLSQTGSSDMETGYFTIEVQKSSRLLGPLAQWQVRAIKSSLPSPSSTASFFQLCAEITCLHRWKTTTDSNQRNMFPHSCSREKE